MELTDEEFVAQCDVIIGNIGRNGLDGYLVDHESPDTFKDTDPRLFQLWNRYLSIANEIMDHLNTAGGRRKMSDGTDHG